MQQAWILRYGELGLKSRVVRRQFQRALSNNMESLAENAGISLIQDRIKTMEVVTSNSEKEDVERLLCHVLGVVAVDPAKIISQTIDPETVAKAILENDPNVGQRRTLGVRTKRVGPKGKIRGACGGKSKGEGKPKCLPLAKARALGKKGRASAARRKRRKDPNPDRRGKAINVNTKKKKAKK